MPPVGTGPRSLNRASIADTMTHVIVLPGGGYADHAAHEGEPVVKWLKGLGLEASVFRYPLHVRHPIPLHALQAEIRRLRRDGVTRVGLIGFSAGGHLAGMAPDGAQLLRRLKREAVNHAVLRADEGQPPVERSADRRGGDLGVRGCLAAHMGVWITPQEAVKATTVPRR